MPIVHFTKKSDNQKTGPIPVTITEASTCPPACPFKDKGCYAKYGPLGMHWKKVTSHERGESWKGFLKQIAGLEGGTLWRHNAAGDLPGRGNTIDQKQLLQLVQANQGKRGFTYTHKPMDNVTNRHAVKHANRNGFTINLSADDLAEADELARLKIGPVVTTLLRGVSKGDKVFTPAGRRVIPCPAQTHEGITCSTCKLCALPNRRFIIGFIAHGQGAAHIEKVYQGA